MKESHGAAVLRTCVLGTVLVLAGCGGEDEGEPAQPVDVRVEGSALVVVVEEIEHDGFAAPLADDDDMDGVVSAVVSDGKLHLATEVANVLDSQDLADHGVTLSEADTPLSRCGLVILHRIVYAGQGRRGDRLHVYGFGATPGAIPLDLPSVTEAIEYDPATAESDLLARLAAVRLAPDVGDAIAVRDGGDGSLSVTAFGQDHALAAGASVAWEPTVRRLRVREAALLAESIDLEGLPPGDPEEVVFPAFDHGEVEFRTEWRVTFAGDLPRVVDTPVVATEELR